MGRLRRVGKGDSEGEAASKGRDCRGVVGRGETRDCSVQLRAASGEGNMNIGNNGQHQRPHQKADFFCVG